MIDMAAVAENKNKSILRSRPTELNKQNNCFITFSPSHFKREKMSSKAAVIEETTLVFNFFPSMHNFQIQPNSSVICQPNFRRRVSFL